MQKFENGFINIVLAIKSYFKKLLFNRKSIDAILGFVVNNNNS